MIQNSEKLIKIKPASIAPVTFYTKSFIKTEDSCALSILDLE